MSRKIASGFLLLLVALSLLLVTAPASAIGLGVSPEKLNIEVSRGGSASAMLGIINTGNEESNYKVYVEEEKYKGWFTIEPEEFTLPAQGTKAVELTIRPPLTASGEHEARICIVSLPPGEGLAIGTGMAIGAGIKVPTYIHVSAMLSLPWIIGIVAVVAIILVIVLRRRRA